MTTEEFISLLEQEQKHREAWLKITTQWRHNANTVEINDPILATMLRRMALMVEQYYQRINATLLEKQIDAADQHEKDTKQLLDDLFARIKKP